MGQCNVYGMVDTTQTISKNYELYLQTKTLINNTMEYLLQSLRGIVFDYLIIILSKHEFLEKIIEEFGFSIEHNLLPHNRLFLSIQKPEKNIVVVFVTIGKKYTSVGFSHSQLSLSVNTLLELLELNKFGDIVQKLTSNVIYMFCKNNPHDTSLKYFSIEKECNQLMIRICEQFHDNTTQFINHITM